jgi:hypothetical protein
MVTLLRAQFVRRRLFLEALEDRRTPAVFTVNALTDTGAGTGLTGDLRYCINQTNAMPGDDQINIMVTGTITLAAEGQFTLSDISGKTTITGPGANLLTIDAHSASRIFQINKGVTAEISGVTLTNGNAFRGGGAIQSSGTLTVANSVISGNFATGVGGAGGGGGIYNDGGAVLLMGDTISGNSAGTGLGGGILNIGSLSLQNTIVSGNHVSGGGSGGGIYCVFGPTTITNSTISGNSASNAGGGIVTTDTSTITNSTISGNSAHVDGGGILNLFGHLTVTNSTVNGNSARGSGGGINNTFSNSITIKNSTISGNSALVDGGGIYNAGAITVAHAIINDNFAITGGGIDDIRDINSNFIHRDDHEFHS